MEQQTKPQKREEKKANDVGVFRILSTDIEGKSKVYPGLTKIKGVSWSLSNITCKKLNIEGNKKIVDLTQEEIGQITEFLKNPKNVPEFILNRRRDFTTGESKHLIGNELDFVNEFDIKRLKKIKSYRGLRHATKQPVRGQRTRSHFRTKKKQAGGIKKK